MLLLGDFAVPRTRTPPSFLGWFSFFGSCDATAIVVLLLSLASEGRLAARCDRRAASAG